MNHLDQIHQREKIDLINQGGLTKSARIRRVYPSTSCQRNMRVRYDVPLLTWLYFTKTVVEGTIVILVSPATHPSFSS
jgi:hypothetical protein